GAGYATCPDDDVGGLGRLVLRTGGAGDGHRRSPIGRFFVEVVPPGTTVAVLRHPRTDSARRRIGVLLPRRTSRSVFWHATVGHGRHDLLPERSRQSARALAGSAERRGPAGHRSPHPAP